MFALVAQFCPSVQDRVKDYILRGYAILLCIIGICIELEVEMVLHGFKIMENWIAKGLYFGFIGVLTLSSTAGDYTEVQNIIAFMVSVLSVVYFFLGLICAKTIKEARMLLNDLQQRGGDDSREIEEGGSASPPARPKPSGTEDQNNPDWAREEEPTESGAASVESPY